MTNGGDSGPMLASNLSTAEWELRRAITAIQQVNSAQEHIHC